MPKKKQPYRKINWESKQVQKDLRKLSPTAFAQKHKVSYPLVVKHRKVAGLSKPHSTRLSAPTGFLKDAQRLTVISLAKKYGVCRSTADAWRQEVGVTGDQSKRYRDEQLSKEVRHYALLEWTVRAIANKLAVSHSTVYRIAKTYEIVLHARTRDLKIVRLSVLSLLSESGLSQADIAKVMNMPSSTVSQLLGPKK